MPMTIENFVMILKLLLGTVIYRPYVYGFFLCFAFFSIRQLRLRGAVVYLVLSYLIAFLCEFNSTRSGFPFGMYVYLDETRVRELWISNIPFWDSLSFVFLSYFSWLVASTLRNPFDPQSALLDKSTAFLAGLLMVLLDVVIDPLTLLGDRWFLGKIYYYPQGGNYFGVTLENFVGWFFVGAVTILVFQQVVKSGVVNRNRWEPFTRRRGLGALGVYAGVFLFNLGITAWIGQWDLFRASALVVGLTLLPMFFILNPQMLSARRSLEES